MREKIKNSAVKCALTLFIAACLTACGGEKSVVAQEGETVSTALFDFSISDVQIINSYTNVEVPDGSKLVSMQLAVENTSDETYTMFAEDFQLQWGDGDEDFGVCLPAVDDEMIPYSYELEPGQSHTGTMLVTVPADCTQLTVAYQEIRSSGKKGTAYFVEAAL